MGTVVVHAGMGKAGSSSVQQWLAGNARRLREADICLLTARASDSRGRDGPVQVQEYRSGPLVANDVVYGYEAGHRQAVLAHLFGALDATASRHRIAVVSAEAFESFFWRVEPGFLDGLEELARRHEVRVAYYVRPQHTAFEAHWRQWGFRTGRPPSEFLARRSGALQYFDTYASVRQRAPHVAFDPRPFRQDLLTRGDPGADFGRHFLGVEASSEAAAPLWANRGLPLEVVNALRYAPPDLLWTSIRDNSGLKRLKKLLADHDSPETEETARSRRLLQAYCFQEFEPGNSRLIAALGWNTETFISPPEEPPRDAERSLVTLDELWEPKASETELQLLYSAFELANSARLAKPKALPRERSAKPKARHRRGASRFPRPVRRWLRRSRRRLLHRWRVRPEGPGGADA